MIRPILRYGDRQLHDAASDVATFDDNLQRLIDDMIETMYAAPGVGLAATQVGVPLRLFVVDLSPGSRSEGTDRDDQPAIRDRATGCSSKRRAA